MFSTYNINTGELIAFNCRAKVGEYEIEYPLSDMIRGKTKAFYKVVDGVFTVKTQTEVDAIIAQREADAQARAERWAGIESAQGTSGLKQYTVEQVSDYLDNRMAAMVDLDTVKVELRKILDKMVPYLLG